MTIHEIERIETDLTAPGSISPGKLPYIIRDLIEDNKRLRTALNRLIAQAQDDLHE